MKRGVVLAVASEKNRNVGKLGCCHLRADFLFFSGEVDRPLGILHSIRHHAFREKKTNVKRKYSQFALVLFAVIAIFLPRKLLIIAATVVGFLFVSSCIVCSQRWQQSYN